MKLDKTSIQELKQYLSELVEIMSSKGNYSDALLMDEESLSLSKDKDEINIDSENELGVKLRLFDGEQFHIYACTGIDKDMLMQKAKELSAIRPLSNISLEINDKVMDKHFEQKGMINPKKIPLQQKTQLLNDVQRRILENGKPFVNARVLISEDREVKIFVNRFKKLSYDFNSCFFMVLPFVKAKNNDVRYHFQGFFSSGFEATKLSRRKFDDIIDKAKSIADAKKIKPGKYTCILAPSLSGLLAHESFGHGMESDTLLKDRAKAKEYLGKDIAKPFVSIIDNPAYPSKNGSFFFDDEGMISKPTYLINNGKVANPITDIFSYTLLKKEGLQIHATANARAESYDHKCYARMSNTYFGPGRTPLAKMLRQVDDGLYLHYSSGGMEDPKGWHVQIQGIVAEKIKNGKLTGEFFYEVGMTGSLPIILGNINAVSNKLDIPGVGRCGKGHKEWVRVSEGGPHLLIKDLDLA